MLKTLAFIHIGLSALCWLMYIVSRKSRMPGRNLTPTIRGFFEQTLTGRVLLIPLPAGLVVTALLKLSS